jgi:hypothetical protein
MIICDITRQPGGIVGTATVELHRDGEEPVTLRLDLSEAAFDAFVSGDWAAVGKLANGEKPVKAPRPKQASVLSRTREPKAEPKAASKPVPELEVTVTEAAGPEVTEPEIVVAEPEALGPETGPQTGPEATEVAIIKGEAVLDLEADVPDYDLAEQPDVAPPVLDEELTGADLALVDGGSSFEEEF